MLLVYRLSKTNIHPPTHINKCAHRLIALIYKKTMIGRYVWCQLHNPTFVHFYLHFTSCTLPMTLEVLWSSSDPSINETVVMHGCYRQEVTKIWPDIPIKSESLLDSVNGDVKVTTTGPWPKSIHHTVSTDAQKHWQMEDSDVEWCHNIPTGVI
jgi:hypothetical protein